MKQKKKKCEKINKFIIVLSFQKNIFNETSTQKIRKNKELKDTVSLYRILSITIYILSLCAHCVFMNMDNMWVINEVSVDLRWFKSYMFSGDRGIELTTEDII